MKNADKRLHSGERVVFDKGDINLSRHLAVYEFAKQFTIDKLVLDNGCGSGYGTYLISKHAKQTIGIDISEESVEYAKTKFKNTNLQYLAMDSIDLKNFKDNLFDVVLSIMVVEHINNYNTYLREIKRVLKPEGILILATNNKEVMSPKESGFHFHKYEFNPEELKNILLKFYNTIEIFGEFENKRVAEAEKIKGRGKRLLSIFLKVDFLKIRKILPKGIREYFSENILRKKLVYKSGYVKPEEITINDFYITSEKYYEAPHFICVCKS